jgi:pimeloyl-ACP methyl ester carboxylesterase
MRGGGDVVSGEFGWAEVNNVTLRYRLCGSGPRTLVLVHEMGGAIESWDLVLPLLAPHFRVLCYDTRGAGLSEKVRGALNIDTMAADLLALLDHLGMSAPVAMAGCAVGAAIAIHFAARYPDRIALLVALSPATGVPAEHRESVRAYADTLDAQGMRATIDDSMSRSYPPDLRGDAARFARFRAQRMANDPASLAAINRMLNGLDMDDDFAAIRCPTLVVAGTRDLVRPPAMVEPIARAVAGARYRVLESGHFMATQTPEPVAAMIVAFLTEVSG